MRRKNPAILGTVFLGLGLFVLAPSQLAPTAARARMSNSPPQPSTPQLKHSAKASFADPKPTAVLGVRLKLVRRGF